MNLTRYEQETVVNWNAEEDYGVIYTCCPADKRKLAKLAEECPEGYRLVKQDEVGVTYEFDKKLVSFRKPRKLTEEQKKVKADQLRRNLSKK